MPTRKPKARRLEFTAPDPKSPEARIAEIHQLLNAARPGLLNSYLGETIAGSGPEPDADLVAVILADVLRPGDFQGAIAAHRWACRGLVELVDRLGVASSEALDLVNKLFDLCQEYGWQWMAGEWEAPAVVAPQGSRPRG